MWAETITIEGTGETITVTGSSDTLTVSDGTGTTSVVALSCPAWSLSLGEPETVAVNIPSPEVVVISCEQGPPGPQGPTGATSPGSTFIYPQNTPATVWNIAHNLGQYPSVTVVDSGGNVVIGDITYVNNDNITLNFVAPFGGKAYLN